MAPLTLHAKVRSRQRAVSPDVIALLLRCGRTEYDHQGGRRHFFTAQTITKAMQSPDREAARLMQEYRNAYVVVSMDGAIITVGYRRRQVSSRYLSCGGPDLGQALAS